MSVKNVVTSLQNLPSASQIRSFGPFDDLMLSIMGHRKQIALIYGWIHGLIYESKWAMASDAVGSSFRLPRTNTYKYCGVLEFSQLWALAELFCHMGCILVRMQSRGIPSRKWLHPHVSSRWFGIVNCVFRLFWNMTSGVKDYILILKPMRPKSYYHAGLTVPDNYLAVWIQIGTCQQ